MDRADKLVYLVAPESTWTPCDAPDNAAAFVAKLAAGTATVGDTVNAYLDWKLAAEQCFAKVARNRQWNLNAVRTSDAVPSTDNTVAVPQGTSNGSAQGNDEASSAQEQSKSAKQN